MRWCALVALLVACGNHLDSAPPPQPTPTTQARPATPEAPPPDVIVPPEDPRVKRLATYVTLLAVDFAFYELLADFPGAPSTTRFLDFEYPWNLPGPHKLSELTPAIVAAVAAAAETPRTPVDEAVAAYTAVLATWWPKIESLHDYFADQRFVDDEFVRGRHEAPQIARASSELSHLRTRMRAAVFAAWRERSNDTPSSPRAIVARSWEACMTYADRVMSHAGQAALDAAVSGCRHATATIAALPPSIRGDLDARFRLAASSIGNAAAAQHLSRIESAYALGELTGAYLARRRDLPTTP